MGSGIGAIKPGPVHTWLQALNLVNLYWAFYESTETHRVPLALAPTVCAGAVNMTIGLEAAGYGHIQESKSCDPVRHFSAFQPLDFKSLSRITYGPRSVSGRFRTFCTAFCIIVRNSSPRSLLVDDSCLATVALITAPPMTSPTRIYTINESTI